MPTHWGPSATKSTTDFLNKQFSPGGKAMSLRGKRTTLRSYRDLKIMGWEARKSHSTRCVLSGPWRLLFKYPGVTFTHIWATRVERASMGTKAPVRLQLEVAVTAGAVRTDPLASF